MGWFGRLFGGKTRTHVDTPLDATIVEALELTRTSYLRIEASQDDRPLPPTASKIGGVPYVPVGSEPPVAAPYRLGGTGDVTTALAFVAQLDFAEVDLEPFPRSGLLQLWVAADDLYGYRNMTPGTPDEYRVIFYPTIDRPGRTDLPPPLELGPLQPKVLANGRALTFTRDTCILDSHDCLWKPFLAKHGVTSIASPPGYDNAGHRIGGYCAFTQEDPRDPADRPLSLLQLDSDDVVFWGDTGIAHWFIGEADLRAQDFSKVQYYWDCC